MTINKTGLSLAAIALVSTGLLAANLNVSSNKTFANELVTVQDYNGTSITLDANSTTIVPTNLVGGISAGNGKINLIFSGARIGSNFTDLKVYDKDRNATVGINPTLSSPVGSTVKSQLTFDVNDTINNGDTLYFSSNPTTLTNITADASTETALIPLDILKDTAVINMKVQFANVSAQELDVTSEKAVYTGKDQWTAAVTTKFNALIDATASFYSFTTTNSTATVDAAKITFTSSAPDLSANATMKIRTTVDNNVSLYATMADSLTSNQFTAATTGYELNATSAVNPTTYDINASISGANTTAILEEVFTVSVDANYTNNGSSTLISAVKKNFGEWTIYGYNARIPNVSGLSTHDTTMKFTNRSSLDTNIYFTLIDPDGTIVTLNSVTNTSLAALPANDTGTYKASALVALITDTNFDSTGSFSVEVSIPTTPTSVYGMASFKNTVLGQFKDLPVYNNNSTYTY